MSAVVRTSLILVIVTIELLHVSLKKGRFRRARCRRSALGLALLPDCAEQLPAA
jgi:hypothetical protein